MSLVTLIALACCLLLLRPAAAQKVSLNATAQGLPPLIPLRALFGNANYSNPQLSPDGKYLAYVRPSADGVNNVFIRSLPAADSTPDLPTGVSLFAQQGTSKDKQVTFDNKRGITMYDFTWDGSAIIYRQDMDGDENWHLFKVPLSELLAAADGKAVRPKVKDITPYPGVRVEQLYRDRRAPQKLYITLNARDPRVFDLYTYDLKTDKLSLHTVNPGDVVSWLFDYDFKLKGAVRYNNNDGSTDILIKDGPADTTTTTTAPRDADALFQQAFSQKFSTPQWIKASSSGNKVAEWRVLLSWPFEDGGEAIGFNKDGDKLFISTSAGRNTTELQLVSTAPGAKVVKRIATNPLVDVGDAVFDPDTWEPELVAFNYHKNQWTVLNPKQNPKLAAEWAKISNLQPGDEVVLIDKSKDKKSWLLQTMSDSKSARCYLYREGAWPPVLLFESRPVLKPYKLAKMHPVVITARDGLKLAAYLTLPLKEGVPSELPAAVAGPVPNLTGNAIKDFDDVAAANVVTEKAGSKPLNLSLPMILWVHGGPWARDEWALNSVVQLFANRGYAVLQVNFRGSTGYGKTFLNAGNGQWGRGTMQNDLTDAVKWAISKGIADPSRICIGGGSYGGYATLAGLAFTPELYRCGIDMVGISNVASVMKSMPPYWTTVKYSYIQRMGNAENNQTLNRMISPLYHADEMRAPLLIGQGANDPRVPKAEADHIYSALKKRGFDVQYMLYLDEGHSLVRPDNRLHFFSQADQFLAKHLGGRSEPPLKVEGARVQVVTRV